MSIAPPCKEWLTAPKYSPGWVEGVKTFIEFTVKTLGKDVNQYLCPCKKCKNYNSCPKSIDEIHGDILQHGFDVAYRTWIHHGKLPRANDSSVRAPMLPTNKASFPGIADLFFDTLDHVELGNHVDFHSDSVPQYGTAADVGDGSIINVDDGSSTNVDYIKRMLDALQPLYPDCGGEHTKLTTIVELLSMKARYQCSDVFFTELLKFMKTILADGNTLPNTCSKAKNMITPFNLPVQIIHACINDCILYRKSYADCQECPTCGESRWQVPPEGTNPNAKKVPVKKLRYFQITERLQRMYGHEWIAEQLYYHSKVESSTTHMRHLVDSESWKSVDLKWPEFAREKRNVRLGLATDGFNPFGMMSSHITWPVMLVPFNLPPSICMSKDFTMLALLIPGPSGPNHNIDVYLQPLIDELIELWLNGKVTYDAHTKTSFTMKEILLLCIHDFPAYAHIAGLRTSERFGCPVYGEETDALRLKFGKKYAYMGHRRFLREQNHPYRREKGKFNGSVNYRGAPSRLSGAEVFSRTETSDKNFGKLVKRPKVDSPYSKRSILFSLPYWKFLHIRHNVDVMHVEKNFTENFFGTIMNHKEKSKNGVEARRDLQLLNLKPNLWLTEKNGRQVIPHTTAAYYLPKNERELFCKSLSKLKVPIGYSGNWKKKVCLKEFQFKGNLKSHDYHILMQGLMPILLMYSFKNHRLLRNAIRNVSLFFKVLCSKVIDCEELRLMHERLVDSLCVFEIYFPPSYFVSMTHMVVHLAKEAQTLGPVQFRWMYPFERMMRTYKVYGRNKNFIEGSICAQYELDEGVRHCMEFIPECKKKSYKCGGKVLLASDVYEGPIPENSQRKPYMLSLVQHEQVRKWVLRHSDENTECEEKYKTYTDHCSNQRRIKPLDYIPWLRKQLEGTPMTDFHRIAIGPSFSTVSYNSYAVNGYLFYTTQAEKHLSTQNSGVTLEAFTSFRASAKDTNLVEDDTSYFGIVQQILELDYGAFTEVVFYCDWVRVEDKTNGSYVEPETNARFVNFEKFKRSSKEVDEPFIHASQAGQVFYCADETREHWHLVLESPKRSAPNVNAYEDPYVFTASANEASD